MNILFFTQSASLKVFYDVLQAIRRESKIEKAGFYVSDRRYYQKFLTQHQEIEAGQFAILKEWVVARDAAKRPNVDINKLKEYEIKLGVSNFWDVLVSDRRIVNGPKYAFRQDYTPRYSHSDILKILLENVTRIEQLFDEIRPNFVAGFICTTVGEYLGYLLARSRNIPYLNLRATRIENYMMYGRTVHEPSEFVLASYQGYQESGSRDKWHHRAKEYISFSRDQHARYEGVFLTTQKPPQVGDPLTIVKRSPLWLLKKITDLIRGTIASRGSTRHDHHFPGLVMPLLYRNLFNPLLVKRINAYLADKYVPNEELLGADYVFFPLAKEPEVTLLVYSKPYLNQIEVVRNVAYSLPVGKLLLVKEHPASVGTRPLKYYQKLLQIPNVRLIEPQVEPRVLIEHADLVVTIAGSVGFEALLLKKPVIIFGQAPYEMLPLSMLRKVVDLNKLGETIADLLKNHHHDDRVLLNYIAATMKESVPIEFYTKLLGRSGQFATAADSDRQEHVARLTDYTLRMVEKARQLPTTQRDRVKVIDSCANGSGRNGQKQESVVQKANVS